MIRQLIDFYTKKEHRIEMLRAVCGVELMFLCYVKSWWVFG